MFEGKPPRPGENRLLEEEQVEAESLRPLKWDELVARLTAARDLRSEMTPPEASEGSFDAGSARRIAAHHNGKQAVNLEHSSNGKGAGGTASKAVHDAGPFVTPGAVRK